MKVLKEGKWNVPWTMEVTCTTCEAKLLVEEVDVKPTYDTHNAFYCLCAICGKENKLLAKDITLRVREAVEKKRAYDRGGYLD